MSIALFFAENVKNRVETISSFIDWVAEILTGNNQVKKWVMGGTVSGIAWLILKFYLCTETGQCTQKNYVIGLGLISLSFFLVAIAEAVRVKRKSLAPNICHSFSAIKGLRPFETCDTALFRQLQREDELRECLYGIQNAEFRFGILYGASGVGKTSFLKAGLLPKLLEENQCCIYVKITDQNPLDSIRSALLNEVKRAEPTLSLISSNITDSLNAAQELPALLDAMVRIHSGPCILLLDQFEQFFVHHKREKQRKPFIQGLTDWYRSLSSSVKILLCFREDFAAQVIELQKSMGYSLGPLQSFPLKRFQPYKAAEIFKVIAAQEKIHVDNTFLDTFTQCELACKEDGLVSPVYIQILSWMVAGQILHGDMAFNQRSFQKIGGIEGLLVRFLTRALEARETKERKQAAIKVLLALAEEGTRAKVLSVDMLKRKLAATVEGKCVQEAADWLARSDNRLITPVDGGFELVHENLIPAVRRVAGEQLTLVDQANRLLNQRVTEWLRNDRSARYLLPWREWRQIQRQKLYLEWEERREHKESLLTASKRYWLKQVIFLVFICPIVIAGVYDTLSSKIEQRRIGWIRDSELTNYTKLALETMDHSRATISDQVKAQNASKNLLRKMQYGVRGYLDGYFFVYDLKGLCLVHPRIPAFEGTNRWLKTSSDRNDLYIQRIIKTASNGGGFVNYQWLEPTTGKWTPKRSYVTLYKPWGWVIGTGIYINDVNRTPKIVSK